MENKNKTYALRGIIAISLGLFTFLSVYISGQGIVVDPSGESQTELSAITQSAVIK